MSVSFRKANAHDDEIILELMREFYAFENLAFDEAAARRALNQILANENFGQIWIIEQSEKIAGYAVLTFGFSLEFHGRDAFVDEIYLRSGFRGAGIGKAALEFLQKQCSQLGVRALHLEVERANENAQAVYRKSGFVEHDRFLMTRRIEQSEK